MAAVAILEPSPARRKVAPLGVTGERDAPLRFLPATRTTQNAYRCPPDLYPPDFDDPFVQRLDAARIGGNVYRLKPEEPAPQSILIRSDAVEEMGRLARSVFAPAVTDVLCGKCKKRSTIRQAGRGEGGRVDPCTCERNYKSDDAAQYKPRRKKNQPAAAFRDVHAARVRAMEKSVTRVTDHEREVLAPSDPRKAAGRWPGVTDRLAFARLAWFFGRLGRHLERESGERPTKTKKIRLATVADLTEAVLEIALPMVRVADRDDLAADLALRLGAGPIDDLAAYLRNFSQYKAMSEQRDRKREAKAARQAIFDRGETITYADYDDGAPAGSGSEGELCDLATDVEGETAEMLDNPPTYGQMARAVVEPLLPHDYIVNGRAEVAPWAFDFAALRLRLSGVALTRAGLLDQCERLGLDASPSVLAHLLALLTNDPSTDVKGTYQASRSAFKEAKDRRRNPKKQRSKKRSRALPAHPRQVDTDLRGSRSAGRGSRSPTRS